MHNLFAMLPCYNEEKDIEPLVHKWMELKNEFTQHGYDLSVYCINDCSTDSTKGVILGLCDTFPEKVHLVNHEVNLGLGGALLTAVRQFLKLGSGRDICVLMDGDNTHDPVFTLSMLPKIESGADCVIASRYCGASTTKGVSAFRLFLSWGARVYYSLLLNVKGVKDYTCGYRAYAYSIINTAYEKFGDDLVERRSFACMMELLYKLSLCGAKFEEVPFALRYDNKAGESKMRIIKTVRESLITAFSLRVHTSRKA